MAEEESLESKEVWVQKAETKSGTKHNFWATPNEDVKEFIRKLEVLSYNKGGVIVVNWKSIVEEAGSSFV
ncbi:hypothetical protein LCGC14_0439410 [marine sediment metagenome]|uniref:Uncharacterized protein n=1 Tax=marine sediment metagenome TaxID=412755 RepID=A0A0F9VV71_9ZZZZ